MSSRHRLRIAIVAALAGASPAPAFAWGIEWSDTYLNVRHLWGDTQPGYTGTVPYTAGNISYANGWTYGSNFVSLDLENIGKRDGANTVISPPPIRSDSLELYSVFRTTLSLNKVTGSKSFSWGPISDVGIELGGDIDTQNDQFASYKRLVVFGPQFSIAVPKGFWTISTVLSHEWNTNAYLPDSTATSFDVTAEIETAWMIPFTIGSVPLKFTGYANFIGPKGRGTPADFYHRMEILLHPKLMVDVGSLMGYTPGKIEAGIGYEYWFNKFGSTPQHVPGTQQNAVFIEAGYHF